MAKPFKFRFVNEIVGAFVLVVVAILVVGIILAGQAQEWFIPKHRIQIDFPLEGSLGLQKGAQVRILGWTVGQLEQIAVDEDGRMSGEIVIKGDFIRFVRLDSEVLVKKMYEIAGEAYIEITQGHLEPLEPGFNLAVVKGPDLTDLARDLLAQVQEAVVPALKKLEVTIEEYGKLAADLRSTNGPVMRVMYRVDAIAADAKDVTADIKGITGSLKKITEGIEKGEGSVGQILKDPAFADQMRAALTNVNVAIEGVNRILSDVEATTKQFPPMAATVGREVEDLPGLMLQTKETIREAERLIQGIQQHWLLRNSMPQPETPRLIQPSEVGSP